MREPVAGVETVKAKNRRVARKATGVRIEGSTEGSDKRNSSTWTRAVSGNFLKKSVRRAPAKKKISTRRLRFFVNPLRLKQVKQEYQNNGQRIRVTHEPDIWKSFTGSSGRLIQELKLSSELCLRQISQEDLRALKNELGTIFSHFFLRDVSSKGTATEVGSLSAQVFKCFSTCVLPEKALEYRKVIDSAASGVDSRILYGALANIIQKLAGAIAPKKRQTA